MRDLLLPLSLFALAVAVSLHAVVPALADVPPSPELPPPPPAPAPVAQPVAPAVTPLPPLAPECHPIRLGTAREMEKVMGELHAAGRDQMLIVGSGMVCGWR